LRAVDVGDIYGNFIAVKGGVQAGEKVITSGASLVKSGDNIRIIP
jgi:multidrug efflux pump subunit AcrA (membrane-fusion protein)